MDPSSKRLRLLHPKENPERGLNQEPALRQVQAQTLSSTSSTHTTQGQRSLIPREERLPVQTQAHEHSAHTSQASTRWPKMVPKSKAQWNQVRDLVQKHHIEEGMTVREVIQMIDDILGLDVK